MYEQNSESIIVIKCKKNTKNLDYATYKVNPRV